MFNAFAEQDMFEDLSIWRTASLTAAVPSSLFLPNISTWEFELSTNTAWLYIGANGFGSGHSISRRDAMFCFVLLNNSSFKLSSESKTISRSRTWLGSFGWSGSGFLRMKCSDIDFAVASNCVCWSERIKMASEQMIKEFHYKKSSAKECNMIIYLNVERLPTVLALKRHVRKCFQEDGHHLKHVFTWQHFVIMLFLYVYATYNCLQRPYLTIALNRNYSAFFGKNSDLLKSPEMFRVHRPIGLVGALLSNEVFWFQSGRVITWLLLMAAPMF